MTKKPEKPYTPPADQYQGLELKPYDGRPGCNAILSFPSRIGPYRHYPDGTKVFQPIEKT
jgi:hypothetical protein